MSFTDLASDASNMNPAILQWDSEQCNVFWNQGLIPYFYSLPAKPQAFEINDQLIILPESFPLSAIITTIPITEYVYYSPTKSCEEINCFSSLLEKYFLNQQIIIQHDYKDTIDKIASFKNLSSNWDSYRSKQIDINCISRASKIMVDLSEWKAPCNIPAPFVAPRADGSIQMEWEKGSRYFELGIGPDSTEIEFLVMEEDHDGKPVEFEGVLEFDQSIKKLLQWFMFGEAEEVAQLFEQIR
jgi:hypothetical protein